MRKKKLLKYALLFTGVVILSASMLNGCGKSDYEKKPGSPEQAEAMEPVHVVYWNLFSGDDGNVMSELVDRFNEGHPDIYVENLTQDWGQYYTKLRTAVLGGVSPDIAISHKSRLVEMKNNRIILPIDEEASKHGIKFDYNGFTPASVKGIQFDGKNYAVPFDSMFLLLYYNKEVLAELDLLTEDGAPNLGEGLAGFLNALETIKTNASGIHPLVSPCGGAMLPRIWYSIYSQLTDQPFVAEGGNALNLDAEAALEATQMQQKIYQYAPIIEGNEGQLFQSKKAAYMIGTTSSVGAMEAVLGKNMGIMPFPTLGEKAASWTDSHTFILPYNEKRDAKTSAAALAFVQWIGENSLSWAASGALPANQSVLDSAELLALPGRTDYLSVVASGHVFPSSENIWFSSSPDFVEPLENMIKNQASAESTLADLTERINGALEKE